MNVVARDLGNSRDAPVFSSGESQRKALLRPLVTRSREIKSPETKNIAVYHTALVAFVLPPDCRMPMMWGAAKKEAKM